MSQFYANHGVPALQTPVEEARGKPSSTNGNRSFLLSWAAIMFFGPGVVAFLLTRGILEMARGGDSTVAITCGGLAIAVWVFFFFLPLAEKQRAPWSAGSQTVLQEHKAGTWTGVLLLLVAVVGLALGVLGAYTSRG